MHHIEVDQSGRTDTLTVDSALAFSDGIRSAILIPRAVKRACYHYLKAQGIRSHRIGVRLLTAGLVLLLKSPAHNLALETFRGEREPDRRISTEELLEVLR